MRIKLQIANYKSQIAKKLKNKVPDIFNNIIILITMSQQSIDYIVSLLSKANEKISKQKSKFISKNTPETNEIITKLQLEIDSLKKSLPESELKSKSVPKPLPETKFQLEIDSLKKSLSESNETITKLQSEKAEILNNVMNVLKKYKPQYIHADNLSKFNKIINDNKIHKLLNFVKFDLKILNMPQIRNMDDKIIMHIIDNCINLEEIVDSYKLIHRFILYKMRFDVVKYLIDKNIDLTHQNKNGNTSLHIACMGSNKNIIEYLIEKMDKINILNNNGSTPDECLEDNTIITDDEKKFLITKLEAKQ